MREGFYRIDYTGFAGSGFAILVFDTRTIVGSDMVGGKYDGENVFNPQTQMLDTRIKVTVPSGAWLVMGIPAQDKEWEFEFSASFPRETSETPLLIQTPFGPVNVVFRFLRSFPD